MNKKMDCMWPSTNCFFVCYILVIAALWSNDCFASCVTKSIQLKDGKETKFVGLADTQISIATVGISANNSKKIVRNRRDLRVDGSFLFKIVAVCNPSKDAMNMFPQHFPAIGPILVCPKGDGLIVKFLVLNSRHHNSDNSDRYVYHANVSFNQEAIAKIDGFKTDHLSLIKKIQSSFIYLYLANKISQIKNLSILDDLSILNISHFLHHTNVKQMTGCEKSIHHQKKSN